MSRYVIHILRVSTMVNRLFFSLEISIIITSKNINILLYERRPQSIKSSVLYNDGKHVEGSLFLENHANTIVIDKKQ